MLRQMRNHTKTIMIIVVVAFVVSIFAGYGMYRRGGRAGGMKDYAVAKVNGKKVMRSTVERGMLRMAEHVSQSRELTSADLPGLRLTVLNSIAIQSEIEKEIDKQNIKVTNDEVEAAYKQIMDSYPTRESFMEYLQHSGITAEAVKEDLRKQLTQKKLFDNMTADISVDVKEAKEFYDIAKGIIYKEPAGIKVNIATFTGRAAAEKARSAIEAGTPWDKAMEDNKAAIQSSTEYDKPLVLTDRMMTGALNVLKDYPDNKLTPVVDITSTDVYIAIKRGYSPERTIPFDEISKDVITTIHTQKVENKQGEIMDEMLARAQIEITDPSIFPAEEEPEGASEETPEEDKTVSEDEK